MLIRQYFEHMAATLDRIRETQSEAILRAAELAAASIAEGGVLHLFGSGHSHMAAEDMFRRAGGLACINAMLEPSLMELNFGRATLLERLPGFAGVLLAGYDVRPGETIVVISNSGINAVPIEVAAACKEKGLHVVALTSAAHSSRMPSRHPGGKKLSDVADLVIDLCGVYGDAAIPVGDGAPRVGPTSTWAAILIVQALGTAIVDALLRRGIEPPVLISANTAEGDAHNAALLERYCARVRYQ